MEIWDLGVLMSEGNMLMALWIPSCVDGCFPSPALALRVQPSATSLPERQSPASGHCPVTLFLGPSFLDSGTCLGPASLRPPARPSLCPQPPPRLMQMCQWLSLWSFCNIETNPDLLTRVPDLLYYSDESCGFY